MRNMRIETVNRVGRCFIGVREVYRVIVECVWCVDVGVWVLVGLKGSG